MLFGSIYDRETGEYYLNARYYNPEISRFTTLDTYRGEFEEPLSLNLYNYCSGNPVNYMDPSGHHAVWLFAPKSAKKNGHIGLIAAGEKNKWYYLSIGSLRYINKRFVKSEVSNLKVLNKSIHRPKNKLYEKGFKFYGDFSKTINHYKTTVSTKKYNLI